jgi:DNA polymerase-3 subunit gamma/tau
VDLPTVTEMLGIIDPAKLDGLLDLILQKDEAGILAFVHESADYETEMIVDELTLHLKDLLFARDSRFSPLILDRFFRILAEAKELLFLGSDGEFVLSLTLFKMMEALSIKEIDEMIRTLQKELSGVQSAPAPTPPAATAAPAPLAPSRPAPAAANPAPQPAAPETAEAAPPKAADAEEARPAEAPESPSPQAAPDAGELKFKALLEKLYDRDYELGETFERCIRYRSFDGHSLTWESTAQGEEKKRLVTYWGIIRMFVQEIFGFEVKIVNIAKEPPANPEGDKKKLKTPAAEEGNPAAETGNSSVSPPVQAECALPDNAQTASTLEAVELPSSCMNPDTGTSEASKEKDPSTLLKEPMIKEAIALFDPKRVRIKRKS